MTQQSDLLTIGGLALFGIGIVGWVLPSLRLQQYPAAVTPAAAASGGGLTPAVLGLKTTGKKVAMNKGANHANGQRYNCNHTFTNYCMIGYFKAGNAEKHNMKTDGPNHGSCKSLPKCVWIEPQVVINSGQLEMGAEFPHPTNHKRSCPSCKTVGSLRGIEYGFAVAAFNSGGFRRCMVWIAKPAGSKWVKVLDETDKGQITNATLAKRQLFTTGKGMEAEMRFHGGNSGTAMRECNVWEITPPAATTAGFVEAYLGRGILSILEAPVLRRYNNYEGY